MTETRISKTYTYEMTVTGTLYRWDGGEGTLLDGRPFYPTEDYHPQLVSITVKQEPND